MNAALMSTHQGCIQASCQPHGVDTLPKCRHDMNVAIAMAAFICHDDKGFRHCTTWGIQYTGYGVGQKKERALYRRSSPDGTTLRALSVHEIPTRALERGVVVLGLGLAYIIS